MMIENEVKYVLTLRSYEEANNRFPSQIRSSLLQGYDSRGARFRKQENQHGAKYTFNYKFKSGDVAEEFEMAISEEEFSRCYPHCVSTLEKTRFTLLDPYRNAWDIDFFLSNESVYFAMAECELSDEYKKTPETLLPFVANNLVYSIPREEFYDYTSYKISNAEYAANLLTNLTKSIY